MQSLAGGISKAMITTSSGLCVTIFGTMFLPLKKEEKLEESCNLEGLSIEELEKMTFRDDSNLVDKIKAIKFKLPKIKIPYKWKKREPTPVSVDVSV